jgi:hypothetical protein
MAENLEDVPDLAEMPADKPVSEEPVESEVRFFSSLLMSDAGLEPKR